MQGSTVLYREYLIPGFSECILGFENKLARGREGSVHGNRQMCTKTSHRSLCMNSAGIITPIVCQGWCMWSLIGIALQCHGCGNGIAMLLLRCAGSCYWVLMVHKKIVPLYHLVHDTHLCHYKFKSDKTRLCFPPVRIALGSADPRGCISPATRLTC